MKGDNASSTDLGSGQFPLLVTQQVLLPQGMLAIRCQSTSELAFASGVCEQEKVVLRGATASAGALKPVVCVARVTVRRQLECGAIWLVLKGMHRARMVSELGEAAGVRQVTICLERDAYDPHSPVDRSLLRRRLLEHVFEAQPRLLDNPAVRTAAEFEFSLGTLCDVVAHSWLTRRDDLWDILQAVGVEDRVERLLKLLDVNADGYAPRFSPN